MWWVGGVSVRQHGGVPVGGGDFDVGGCGGREVGG